MKPTIKTISERLKDLESDQEATLDDPELCQALDPLRGRLPTRVRCPKGGCKATVGWWALPSKCGGLDHERRSPRVCTTCFVRDLDCAGAYVAGQGPMRVSGARVVWATNAPNMPKRWINRDPSVARFPKPPFPYDVWSIDTAWDGCIPTPFSQPAVIRIHRQDHQYPGASCPPWERTWRQADPSGRWLRIVFACPRCGTEQTRTNTSMLRDLVLAVATTAEVIVL